MEKTAKNSSGEKIPFVRKHKHALAFSLLLLALTLLGLLVSFKAGFLFPEVQKTTVAESNILKATGPVHGMWLDIKKVEKNDKGSLVTAKAYTGGDITVQVNEHVFIAESVPGGITTAKRLTVDDLKEGVKVYVSSYTDMKGKTNLSIFDYNTIEVQK